MSRAPYAVKDYEGRHSIAVRMRGDDTGSWEYDSDADDYLYVPPEAARTIAFEGGAHPCWLSFDVNPAAARELAAVLLQLATDCDGVPGPDRVDTFELLSPTWRARHDGGYVLEAVNGEDSAWQNRFRPESWTRVAWHPSHWRIYRSRTDANGAEWCSNTEPYVMDDFGNLVEVEC